MMVVGCRRWFYACRSIEESPITLSIVLISFISMVLVAPVIGLVSLPVHIVLLGTAVGSLWAICAAFVISSFASNTVKGIAVSKFVGFSLTIPTFAVVLVPEPLQFLAGIVPTYWPLKAIVGGAVGAPFVTNDVHRDVQRSIR